MKKKEPTTIEKTRSLMKIVSFLMANPSVLYILIILLIVVLIFLLIFVPLLMLSRSGAFSDEDGGYIGGPVPPRVDADGSMYVWPTPSLNHLSSEFGKTRPGIDPNPHKGIDIVDARGPTYTAMQPVYAMADGLVTRAGSADGFGQAVYLDHGNGLVTRYGHLQVGDMAVREGEQVSKGQLLGRIGKGRVGTSTGPHLHFQVEEGGKPVNPLKFVKRPTFPVTSDLSYQPMAIAEMREWLQERNSALAKEGILRAIDRAGQSENIDPYLLIAITGQEQSFVPANHRFAEQIARNPWNVFGCWCSGDGANLTTEESAKIAAKTVAKLSQDRPNGVDPLMWLIDRSNPRGVYATHSGWAMGVSKIHRGILKAMPTTRRE